MPVPGTDVPRRTEGKTKTEGSKKAKPSRDPKSCCCPVYAGPDRVAGKAESALKELSFIRPRRDALDPAVSDRTWPKGTGVNRLSSSLIYRSPEHISPKRTSSNSLAIAETFMNAGPSIPDPPRTLYLDPNDPLMPRAPKCKFRRIRERSV